MSKTETRSKDFEKVRMFYVNGFWNMKKIYDAIDKKITEEEFQIITGKTVQEYLDDLNE